MDGFVVAILAISELMRIPVARFLDQGGDPVHLAVQALVFPGCRVRDPVLHLREPVWVYRELKGGRALRAEGAKVDGTVRVALDAATALVPRRNWRRLVGGEPGLVSQGVLLKTRPESSAGPARILKVK
jgi:hypothetical protein